MEIVFTVLILLLCVALSTTFAKISPIRLPLPLVQIGIGAVLTLPVFNINIGFDPEIFMLLFIPPLLFSDGWRIPKKDFFAQQPVILAMALGLVVVSVLVLGYFIHFLIEDIPYPAAFALAAVLAPTDAVAVSGIFGQRYVPKNIMNLLQGEALINDASGLVALAFAKKATIAFMLLSSGLPELMNLEAANFSLWDIPWDFLKTAVGGIIVGLLVNFVYAFSLKKLAKMGGDDATTQIILLLLLPFTAYLFAEHFHTSGILAAVTAGIAQSHNDVSLDRQLSARLQSKSIWHSLEEMFNGMIFILLGLQFSHIITHVPTMKQAGIIKFQDNGELAFTYVLLIGIVLLLIRFFWVWLLERIIVFRARRKGNEPLFQGVRSVAIVTFAGVRGAISLAAVLSIPIFIDKTNILFPQRDVLIFLAAGLILFTLICAVVALPLLMKGLERPPEESPEEMEKRTKILQQCTFSALDAIESAYQEMTEDPDNYNEQDILDLAYANAKHYYEERLSTLGSDRDARRVKRESTITENTLFLKGLDAERNTLQRYRRNRLVDEEMFTDKMHKLDLLEASIRTYQERQRI